jgi:predicted ATPase/class 3 adenylate cyclase
MRPARPAVATAGSFSGAATVTSAATAGRPADDAATRAVPRPAGHRPPAHCRANPHPAGELPPRSRLLPAVGSRTRRRPDPGAATWSPPAEPDTGPRHAERRPSTPVSRLPTGTLTLLFTDIEGSTRLLDELGDRYEDVLGEHNRVLRDAIGRNNGIEVTTQGDSFFAVFPSAVDAVGAAEEAQRRLADAPVRVRMGIHTGEPRLTAEGYVGMDVHRAARIGAVGHGGQVVVSETTQALLGDEFELRDLGEHRLKDIDTPIRVFQLGRDEFPPLRSLSQAQLPIEPAALLGRKRELGDLVRLLGRDRVRLVTLTGPGGIGKTSLAVAAASELVESFREGAVLVELAAVREPALVLPTIAEELGGEESAAEQIAARELLLVLDNLEQVVDAAGEIGRLLGDCPNLSILATSREPLKIAGEREFPLRPLAEAPAVELFRQRAEAVLPGFTADYSRLAEICRRLDSLPLAIELAAARVKVLPPGELLSRLDRRLPLLTASRRDLPARQQTLRATIEWSHDLCSPEEQQLFGRVAVFSGGFTLDAAETVCEAELDVLEGLLDKSLIRRDADRFSMLETIREYAGERLDESGEAHELRRRHAEYLSSLAEEFEDEHLGPEQAQIRERFRKEWDNVRAALDWAVDSGETEVGLRLAGSLAILWLDRNVAVEGERWFRTLLQNADGVDPYVRARALQTASTVAGVRSHFDQAWAWSEEALAEFRALGSEPGVAWTLTNLAIGPLESGRPEEARTMLEEAEALHLKLGNDAGVRRARHLLGQQAAAVGDLERARELLRDTAEGSRRVGDSFSEASSLHSLGDVELQSENIDAAEAAYIEGLRIAWHGGADRLVCYCLSGLAAVAAANGDADRAALLWGFAEAYEERLRFRMRRRSLYAERLEAVAAADEGSREAGSRLDVDSAVEIALGSASS